MKTDERLLEKGLIGACRNDVCLVRSEPKIGISQGVKNVIHLTVIALLCIGPYHRTIYERGA